MFIFRSRSAKSIRLLVYDGQGFYLVQKRLSKGRFRWWPTGDGPARTVEAYQAQLLLAAGNPDTQSRPDVAESELISATKKVHQRACVLSDFLSHCCCAGSNGDIEDVRSAIRRLLSFESSSANIRAQPLCVIARKSARHGRWKQAQRRIARHGVPGPAADAGSRRSDSVACGTARFAQPARGTPARTISADNRPVRGPLGELGVLEFQQVRRTRQEPLFNSLLEQYHYLGISSRSENI